MNEKDLLAGEYSLRLTGAVQANYVGRTTAQEFASLDNAQRLVFWAPEILLKLALPGSISLGETPLQSISQIIDPATGAVRSAGVAVVLRQEGLEKEVYVQLRSGILRLESAKPLTGQLICVIENANGKIISVELCFQSLDQVF